MGALSVSYCELTTEGVPNSACYASSMPTNPKTVLVELGAEVRRRRESLGLSQIALAIRAKLHVNVIGRLERGAHNPTALTLVAIAEALDTSLAEIFAQRAPAKRAKLRAV